MNKEYKKFVVESLYGLIEGSSISLQRLMIDYFKRRFGFDVDSIVVEHTDRFIVDDSKHKGCWIGSMTATLIINGESFSHTRDWGVEYDIDVKHPDFYTDDWFYESNKCFAYNKSIEVINMIDNDLL